MPDRTGSLPPPLSSPPTEEAGSERRLSWDRAARLHVLISAALWGVIIAVISIL
ncbi:MAG: hypothetical protein GVY13_06065 [Alphaproteobacteria bacterium]|jgi:hypothetical protein|nr:hypothetical protein [Alphaproteobacteria bacterium]